MTNYDTCRVIVVSMIGLFMLWHNTVSTGADIRLKSNERFNTDVEFHPFNNRKFVELCLLPRG